MKIVGIIPARFASSRFPGKPLIDITGKTMIRRVYEGVSKSNAFSNIIVATDDQRIFDEVKSFNGEVMMTAESHTTGTDRCGEVIAKIEDADIVVNIQGDEPLVDFRQLDQLIKAFDDDETQIATLGIKIDNSSDLTNPNRIKLVADNQNNALYFSRSAIPNQNNAKAEDLEHFPFLRHIGLYAYRKDVLTQLVKLKPTALERIESLEQLRWLYHGFKIKIVETTIETPNIDVKEDLAEVLKKLS